MKSSKMGTLYSYTTQPWYMCKILLRLVDCFRNLRHCFLQSLMYGSNWFIFGGLHIHCTLFHCVLLVLPVTQWEFEQDDLATHARCWCAAPLPSNLPNCYGRERLCTISRSWSKLSYKKAISLPSKCIRGDFVSFKLFC